MVESTYTALGGTGFGMPPESANAPLTVDDLPRLTDDEREALDSGLIAMEGVPAAAELQRFHRQSSGRSIGNMPDPLPCPFCQKIEVGGILTNPGSIPDETTYHVTCGHCGAQGPAAGSLLEAVTRWNAATNSGEQESRTNG